MASSSKCRSIGRATSWSDSRAWTAARIGIVANQPAFLAGCLDIDSSTKGAPFRPLLRRFQYSDSDVRRRARISSRHRAGVRRHHPPRRETALRLCRSDRAENHRDHAQSLRRGVLRDGIEASAHRRESGVAHRRNRGDGRGRSGEHRVSPRTRCRRRRSRTPCAAPRPKNFANASPIPSSPPSTDFWTT